MLHVPAYYPSQFLSLQQDWDGSAGIVTRLQAGSTVPPSRVPGTPSLFLEIRRQTGESNGNLPLRTCPGCSVPELYQSPDWALVSAQIGPRAEYL